MAQVLINVDGQGRAQTQFQGLTPAQAHTLLLQVAQGLFADLVRQHQQDQRIETADEAFLRRADQARQAALAAGG